MVVFVFFFWVEKFGEPSLPKWANWCERWQPLSEIRFSPHFSWFMFVCISKKSQRKNPHGFPYKNIPSSQPPPGRWSPSKNASVSWCPPDVNLEMCWRYNPQSDWHWTFECLTMWKLSTWWLVVTKMFRQKTTWVSLLEGIWGFPKMVGFPPKSSIKK